MANYHVAGDVMTITHTEVPPHARNKGIASKLIEEMLVEARARGLKIVPLCPFVRAYFSRHPEDKDLLA